MALVSSVLILCFVQSAAFAAAWADVYAEEQTAASGETVLIPVRIKNNPGLMGFKITVTYDAALLKSPTVNRGTVTKNGNFNDSIGVTPDGAFDVVWNDTQNVSGDGTLMILGFKAVSEAETNISLSFSQPDTFNEAWEDVELNCKSIKLKVVDKSEKPPTTLVQDNPNAQEPDSEEIKSAVEIVLDEKNKGSIDGISEEEKEAFADRVNEVLGQLSEGSRDYFADTDEIEDAYDDAVADKFVENVKASADSGEIENAIGNALDSVNAETAEDIPEEKKTEFVKAVESNLGQSISDFETVSDKLTPDDAIEAIKRLQSENTEEATQGEKVPVTMNDGKNYPVFLIIAVVIVFAAITTIIVVYIYKKKKLKEAKTNEESM